jgi:phage baseplate assembly protein W
MALTQTLPLFDTIAPNQVSVYTNQLSVSGNSGVVTYTTTDASNALIVSSGGAITATGVLGVGSYIVSGTVKDTVNDTGTWVFTLTVVGSSSPITTITPALPPSPTGIEMAVPFQIDPSTGGVAVLTDAVSILAQHIETIVLTMLGERVMMPQYGSPVEGSLFASINSRLIALLPSDITTAIQTWEPSVQVVSVTPSYNITQAPSTLTIDIQFTVVPYANVNTVTVSTGGSVVQVTAPS